MFFNICLYLWHRPWPEGDTLQKSICISCRQQPLNNIFKYRLIEEANRMHDESFRAESRLTVYRAAPVDATQAYLRLREVSDGYMRPRKLATIPSY